VGEALQAVEEGKKNKARQSGARAPRLLIRTRRNMMDDFSWEGMGSFV
jgi:hypothetical protein